MKVLCNITKDRDTLYYMEDLTVLMIFKKVEDKMKLTRLFAGPNAKYLFEQLSTEQSKKTHLNFNQKFYDALYYKLDEASTDTMMAMAKLEDYMNEKLSAPAAPAHSE